MAKKETTAPVTGPDNTGNEKKSRAGTCPSGFYIYIGPNIKKHREARRPGWLFRMETGLNLFIRFDEIYSFTSCGELRIIEKNA